MISRDRLSQILEKTKFWQPEFRPKMSFFCNFIEFGLYVFLEIAYNDSLQQYLTSSDGKTHNKKFGGPSMG